MSLASLLFNPIDRIRLIYGHKQISMTSDVMEIACHFLHALTNKMVPDANSLSIGELTEVANSQNNVEYWRLNYNKFYQLGRIDRSFCMKTMDEAALKQAKTARRSAKSAFTRAGKYSLTL